MSFIYTNNTPQGTQTVALTQPLILGNFSYLPVFGNVDHDFSSNNATTTDGFHTKVTFKANQAAPGFGAGVSVLYAATVGGVSALAFQNASGSYAVTGKNPSVAADGYTCLPGGLLLQWGSSAAVTSSSSTIITFPTAFGVAPYSIQCTPQTDDNSTIRLSILNPPSTTAFSVTHNSTSHFTRMYWIAIGTSP